MARGFCMNRAGLAQAFDEWTMSKPVFVILIFTRWPSIGANATRCKTASKV